MKLTDTLKAWLLENKGTAELTKDSTEDQFRVVMHDRLTDGKLTPAKLLELTEEPQHKAASSFESKLDAILSGQKELADRVDKLETTKVVAEEAPAPAEKKEVKVAPTAPRLDKGNGNESVLSKMFSAGQSPEPSEDLPLIRTVGVEEQYSTTKIAKLFPEFTGVGSRHAFAGKQLFEGGSEGIRTIDEPSELERAVCGAYFKMVTFSNMRGRVPACLRMTDHDQQLIEYALHKMRWGGVIHGEGSEDPNAIAINNRRLHQHEIKALLDDSASGGLELAPIAFDDAVITTPLLNGEFFPFVNVVNITRGRRIEGASIGNPTLSSGGADGTAIPLFNTAGFVAAFDTNIYVVNGAIEIGLDFLSDSPVAVADIVIQRYGEQLLTWLDTQIILGDGTTEPEGVNVASGTVSVNAENGAGGPWTVTDMEALLFGVPKEYKAGTATNRIRYAANETTYQRIRGIAVGTTDQRRVFGMDHETYTIFGHPFGINSGIGNRACTFFNAAHYRMYRRLGLTMRTSTEGKELIRANQMLITIRARFGGQIELGSYVAYCADGQS